MEQKGFVFSSLPYFSDFSVIKQYGFNDELKNPQISLQDKSIPASFV